MTTRTKRLAIAGLIAVLGALAAAWFVLVPRLTEEIADDFGRGDYSLNSTDGSTFTQDTLQGSPSAVFFGFTHCPEVCPTTLGDIATWQEELGSDGPLRTYFVTVDPERDTAEVLGDYVGWVPGVTGVTGSRAEIDKAIKAFKIFARKIPLEGDGYTMDHSAYVLLFDADGKMFEPIGYQEDYTRAIAKIRRLLES